MKKTIAIMLFVCVGSVFASYTYEIGPGQDFGALTLYDHESLLMTGGMGHSLDVSFWSSARIEGTDSLVSEGVGGIWIIDMMSYATLEFLGGDVHQLELGSDSRAVISGGRIDEIRSYQDVEFVAPPIEGDPWFWDRHIEIICRDWEHDVDSNILTGTWEDFSAFDIQLVDVVGYDVAFDNIEFTIVPEPATLLLLGVGGLILRKRRN